MGRPVESASVGIYRVMGAIHCSGRRGQGSQAQFVWLTQEMGKGAREFGCRASSMRLLAKPDVTILQGQLCYWNSAACCPVCSVQRRGCLRRLRGVHQEQVRLAGAAATAPSKLASPACIPCTSALPASFLIAVSLQLRLAIGRALLSRPGQRALTASTAPGCSDIPGEHTHRAHQPCGQRGVPGGSAGQNGSSVCVWQ